MTVITNPDVLTQDILDRCARRAPEYDRDNRFFFEDFEELRAAGYLLMAVPVELGGLGLSLAEVCRETGRLAYHAPATALATNMHVYWTGIAADLYRSGDRSLTWILEEAAAGEVFAAGHGEAGNDLPVLLSTAQAEPVKGGYRFTGHKVFGSLSPVWTRLGIHAMDTTDPDNPKIVHAFMPRSTEGYVINETWDTMGMRATRSDDTLLDGAFVPDKYIARVVPAGFAGADMFVLGIFAWAQPTFASIYLGIARRAMDLAVAGLQKRTSIALGGATLAHQPMLQHAVAEMSLAIEGATPHVEKTADDWSNGVDHGGLWPAKLVATKYHAVEAAKRVVDVAMEVSGGTGMFRSNELERLYRDVRCGGFHPANSALVHEIVGKTALGVLADPQRW
ncbi:MAG TPA: acyl-CoA dehydrogenase family protein [Acidimicrobiia bacterium]|jgi:alkylation response protein AidB-like acyl-CoA dehydrogenase|nr:acyl-CoA dehydrogenase family protein [Acidimicrobiia bacterium]